VPQIIRKGININNVSKKGPENSKREREATMKEELKNPTWVFFSLCALEPSER